MKKDWEFVDVFTFEQEMLSLIPRPVVAVLLLFPLSVQVFSLLAFVLFR